MEEVCCSADGSALATQSVCASEAAVKHNKIFMEIIGYVFMFA